MVDNTIDVLIYLDHNVLDKFTKTQLETIFKRISSTKMVPIYSDETLKEIALSKGYEDKILSLLKDMGAAHLRLELINNRFTGKGAFEKVNPFETYAGYVANTEKLPELGYGLGGMLRKFYGGIKDKTYTEVLSLGVDETLAKVDNEMSDIQADAAISDEEKKMIADTVAQLRITLPALYQEMAMNLDRDVSPSVVTQLDGFFSAGPKILNNIKGPDVVKKIWATLSASIPEGSMTLEKFFGLTPDLYGFKDSTGLSLVEKVNALYHQLNFVGYYRDGKMNDNAKFNASFSDRSHAGCAIFCHYIMSMDERLIMKTAATYEYLGVFTRTVHLKMR